MLREKSAFTSCILVEITKHRPINIGYIQTSVYISVKMTILDFVECSIITCTRKFMEAVYSRCVMIFLIFEKGKSICYICSVVFLCRDQYDLIKVYWSRYLNDTVNHVRV